MISIRLFMPPMIATRLFMLSILLGFYYQGSTIFTSLPHVHHIGMCFHLIHLRHDLLQWRPDLTRLEGSLSIKVTLLFSKKRVIQIMPLSRALYFWVFPSLLKSDNHVKGVLIGFNWPVTFVLLCSWLRFTFKQLWLFIAIPTFLPQQCTL